MLGWLHSSNASDALVLGYTEHHSLLCTQSRQPGRRLVLYAMEGPRRSPSQTCAHLRAGDPTQTGKTVEQLQLVLPKQAQKLLEPLGPSYDKASKALNLPG